MSNLHLIIGNKNYSSWSLRAWLIMRESGLDFEETVIPLYLDSNREKLDEYCPSGKVPVLRAGAEPIWESLAIAEFVNELAPLAQIWPEDQMMRAHARSVSTEMATGFVGLRSQFPMNCRREILGIAPDAGATKDIARIEDIWQECRAKYASHSPYLFGKFSIADAMYAPVVCRFKTYGLASNDISRAYVDTILSMPAMQEWYRDAKAESWVLDGAEL